MKLTNEEIRERIFQIESILGDFWKDGLMSSWDTARIIEMFPERILSARDKYRI